MQLIKTCNVSVSYLPANIISLAARPNITTITQPVELKKGISSQRIEVQLQFADFDLSDDLTAEEVEGSIIQDVIDYMVDEEERDDDITLVAVKVT